MFRSIPVLQSVLNRRAHLFFAQLSHFPISLLFAGYFWHITDLHLDTYYTTKGDIFRSKYAVPRSIFSLPLLLSCVDNLQIPVHVFPSVSALFPLVPAWFFPGSRVFSPTVDTNFTHNPGIMVRWSCSQEGRSICMCVCVCSPSAHYDNNTLFALQGRRRTVSGCANHSFKMRTNICKTLSWNAGSGHLVIEAFGKQVESHFGTVGWTNKASMPIPRCGFAMLYCFFCVI